MYFISFKLTNRARVSNSIPTGRFAGRATGGHARLAGPVQRRSAGHRPVIVAVARDRGRAQ